MDPTTLVIAFAFAWGGLVLYRIHKRRTAAQAERKAGGEAAPKAPAQQNTMPRFGEPGSITYNQTRALQRNNFTPDRNWSREEAALILDTVKYLRTVCRDVAGDEDGPPPLEVQNALLRFILTGQDLRDYVRKWGEDRRAAGAGDFDDDEPELARNDQYARIAVEARKFLSPEAPEQPPP